MRSLRTWLDAVKAAAPVAELRAELRSHPPRVVRIEPEAAQAALAGPSPTGEAISYTKRTIEGRLYAVNLETGRYSIRDDVGNSISLTGEIVPADAVGRFVGQRVQAEGVARQDDSGRLQLELARLGPAPTLRGLESGSFFRNVELDELLAGKAPLDSLDSLVIDDLSDEEIEAFLGAGDG
ncbi:MAG: hypothetical protein ACRD0K_31115 [Egibacteraceae bacterium]